MERRHIYVFTTIQIVAFSVLLWVLFTWTSPWNAERYAGTVLFLLGVSFLAVARYQLGRSFSIKPEAHALVTEGIYSKIRNPIYVFGTVMITGLLLVLQMPKLWIVLGRGRRPDTARATRSTRTRSSFRRSVS
jgi:protein-S-isoprenylcysteine O-methyltransferase Ste14